MLGEIDFGYWRRRNGPAGAGLVSWNPATRKLYWNVPGSGDVRQILGYFEDENAVRAALDGWEDVSYDEQTLDWIERRTALRKLR